MALPTEADVQNAIDTNLADFSDIVPEKHREVHELIKEALFLPYQVLEFDFPQSFVDTNFDGSGLGINDMAGYAICNGNNGTKNRGGRVGICYDATNYPVMGATGGSKDAVLVEHNHDYGFTQSALGTDSSTSIYQNAFPTTINQTSTEGESGTDKNMQPYIVSLFVQRI